MRERLPSSPEVRGRFATARLSAEGGRLQLHDIALTFLNDPVYGPNLAAARVTREQILHAGKIQTDRTSQPDDVYIPPANVNTLVSSAARLAEARRATSIGDPDIFKAMFSVNGGGLEALIILNEDPRGLSETILTGRVEHDRDYHEERRAEIKAMLERNAVSARSSDERAA